MLPRLGSIVLASLITSSGFAADANNDVLDPARTLLEARAFIDGGRYHQANTRLLELVEADPESADGWNLLGFSYRKLGKLQQARHYYGRALELEPNHLGALEYLGELFVETGELAAAAAHLEKLRGLCGEDCEETRDLAEALAAAGS